MDLTWQTDEYGTRTWTYLNWKITTYPFSTNVDVSNGESMVDIDFNPADQLLTVYGRRQGGWEGDQPQRVSIPFQVLAEVVRISGRTVSDPV